jgi:hypothetical protein
VDRVRDQLNLSTMTLLEEAGEAAAKAAAAVTADQGLSDT